MTNTRIVVINNWHATGWVDFLTQHGYRIVGVDLRGHGNSAKLYRPEAYTTAAMAGDSVVRNPRFKDAVITFLRQSAP